MYTEKEFLDRFNSKSDEALIEMWKNQSQYQPTAIAAIEKLLQGRGVDTTQLTQNKADELSIDDFEEEISDRMDSSFSVESVRLAMKDKGYDASKMLENHIEANEEVKSKRNYLAAKVAIWGGVILVVLKVLKSLLKQY